MRGDGDPEIFVGLNECVRGGRMGSLNRRDRNPHVKI